MSSPTAKDYADAYPAATAGEPADGAARVYCTVTDAGELTACEVKEESIVGQGLGQAVLALAPKFKMAPLSMDGQAVGGKLVELYLRIRPPPPSPPPGVRLVVHPTWVARAAGVDAAKYYPVRALRMGVEGDATLQCGIDAQGLLANCVITCEFPKGSEFGGASLALSALFQMELVDKDGQSVVGGMVRLPINWRLPR